VRIAVVAPGWFPVPPEGYGGIELVVALLTDGFVDSGHDVTLFAPAGSHTKATLVSSLPEPPDRSQLGNPWYDAHHALAAYTQVADFDIVHDHAGVMGPVCGAMLGGHPPVVHTLHGPWTDDARMLYDLVGKYVHLVAISDAQAAENRAVKYAAIVHNGIDLAAYPYRTVKDSTSSHRPREPGQGPVEAIRIARQAGRPLRMILNAVKPPGRFDHEINPLLGHDIRLYENVSRGERYAARERVRCCSDPVARAVRPRDGQAMACGTPS
jgi:glycosyltransferase involved in cell wall biosynthesis